GGATIGNGPAGLGVDLDSTGGLPWELPKTHLEREEMTLKTTKLRDAISFALVSGATVLAGTGVAFAQDSSEQQATTLDRIEVTGSRIRQVDIETAQPVVMISREDIQAGGFNSVADILQNIPSAGS